MAVDTQLRRLSIIELGFRARGFLPIPDGSVDAEDRYMHLGLYSGNIGTAPQLVGSIGNISVGADSGTHAYDLAANFAGATSYAISPAVETGWSFNTSSGLLTIDTDAIGSFGPYTVTATNASGDTDSNAFTVKVSTSNVRLFGSCYPNDFRIGF